MVDPDLPAAARTRVILNKFLFNEGVLQFIFVAVLAWCAFSSTFSIVLHSTAAAAGVPSRKQALLFSAIGGFLCSSVLMAALLVVSQS